MIANDERMTLDTIVCDDMIQEVAEMVAYSGLFGDRIDINKLVEEENKKTEEKEKAKKERKPRKADPNRKLKGKTRAAAVGSSEDFWVRHGADAFNFALNDEWLPECQPQGGNYEKTKNFLKNDWSHVQYFKRSEIEKALTEKYPEESMYNTKETFRLSHRGWSSGIYYVESGEMSIKPIYRRIEGKRGTFQNIFYAGE